MSEPIYLDHAATTPLRPEALKAMEPFLTKHFANPSSVYRVAQMVRSAVDEARDVVALCIGGSASEIVFTGGGTESNNSAIKGAAFAASHLGKHIIATTIEHHAVLHPVQELEERFGFEVTYVSPEASGIVDPRRVEAALRADTVLVSAMWANNEIGTIQPIAEIAEFLRSHRAVFQVDAVQAVGLLPVDVGTVAVDLLSLSAHKFYGPKGVGALFVRRGTPFWPLLTGGGQERERRSGTENVPGIVGMAQALELAIAERPSEASRLRVLRDYLLDEIPARIQGTHINGDVSRRLPNNANFAFDGIRGESLLVGLDRAGVMASSGSACSTGALEPSHVLLALGLDADLAQASLRLTLGKDTTLSDLTRTVDVLESVVDRLRHSASRLSA